MKFVYNPGNTSVVYDEGLMVAPGEWAYVSSEGNDLDRLIEQGKLVVVQVPKRLPAEVQPQAIVPLNDAVNDQSAAEATTEASVRDTGEQHRPAKSKSTKKKEA